MIKAENFFRDDLDDRPVIVTIQCLVYNHEPYLRECLEGFVMQQTNFRFEAIVHDDCSTDESAKIIREYAEKYPSIIKPIYEEENQYSKHNGTISRVMDAHLRGKYIALCEGDDYWTDPNKLQMQYDFMESHPDHSLCFHAHYTTDDTSKSTSEIHRYNHDVEVVPMEDMIMAGGGFMMTNSMFYRRDRLISHQWVKECSVGDCPIMLSLATDYKVAYLDKAMCCYRVMAQGSWSQRNKNSLSHRKSQYLSSDKMWKAYDKFTQKKYHSVILKKRLINTLSFYKFALKFYFHRCFNFHK